MMSFDWMTDAELLAAAAKQRDDAHNAPKRLEGSEGSMAFADRARDWAALQAEVKRRGLS